MGVCDMDNMLITIYDGYPQSKINENILHEIIHALDKDMQIGLTENQVHSLGMGLSSCSAVYLVPADLPDFRYGS